jgi:hypothetical protein
MFICFGKNVLFRTRRETMKIEATRSTNKSKNISKITRRHITKDSNQCYLFHFVVDIRALYFFILLCLNTTMSETHSHVNQFLMLLC